MKDIWFIFCGAIAALIGIGYGYIIANFVGKYW